MKDLDSIVSGFLNSTLPKEEWTHETHLSVAAWHIKKFGFYEAVYRLRTGIISLNRFHGTPNTKDSGYHETLTVFWAKIIYLHQEISNKNFLPDLVRELIDSPLASRELPFVFYRKEEILGTRFRSMYAEPTLRKLDTHAIRLILGESGV